MYLYSIQGINDYETDEFEPCFPQILHFESVQLCRTRRPALLPFPARKPLLSLPALPICKTILPKLQLPHPPNYNPRIGGLGRSSLTQQIGGSVFLCRSQTRN